MTRTTIATKARPKAQARAKATSKEKLVKAARGLMLARGYPTTSVDDVVAAAGVSKGSFYHFFESKEDLGLAALHDFLADGAALMMEGSFKDVADPEQRAIAFLKHVENVAGRLWEHGCLLVMFSVEFAGASPRVRTETVAVLKRLTATVGEVLKPLSRDGGGKVPMKAGQLADLYMAVIDGSIVYARATGDTGAIARNLRAFRQVVEAGG